MLLRPSYTEGVRNKFSKFKNRQGSANSLRRHVNINAGRVWTPVSTTIHSLDILLQERSIVLLLHLRHANLEDGLFLGWQALLHICLQPPQQEGA